VNAARAKGK